MTETIVFFDALTMAPALLWPTWKVTDAKFYPTPLYGTHLLAFRKVCIDLNTLGLVHVTWIQSLTLCFLGKQSSGKLLVDFMEVLTLSSMKSSFFKSTLPFF